MSQTRLNLQDDEQAVLAAASRIFAGFASGGGVNQENAKALTQFSMRVAIKLAREIDNEVISSGELELPPLKG